MKLYEHPDRTLERLPDLPPDVQVPDDLRTLDEPATRTTTPVRWMRWLAAIVLVVGAGVVTTLLVRGDDTTQTPVDPMQMYGTDNPVILDRSAEPGTVVITGTLDPMRVYGTDNPVLVPEPTYMDIYGTDNPVFVRAPTPMDLYGTDNPVFVPEPTPMDLYGTDNPVFVPAEPEVEPVDTGEYLRKYGTDNPTFVEP